MIKYKIGVFFIISILALTSTSISYATISDSLSVNGFYVTKIVEYDIVEYSGTDVWKVWGSGAPSDEIFIWRGFLSDPSRPTTEDMVLQIAGGTHAQLISSSWASEGTEYQVNLDWNNIFPCIDFSADFIIKYLGELPTEFGWPILSWEYGYNFSDYITIKAYSYSKDTDGWIENYEILESEFPYQVENGDYICFEVIIHLPQDNNLQNNQGEFSLSLNYQ